MDEDEDEDEGGGVAGDGDGEVEGRMEGRGGVDCKSGTNKVSTESGGLGTNCHGHGGCCIADSSIKYDD